MGGCASCFSIVNDSAVDDSISTRGGEEEGGAFGGGVGDEGGDVDGLIREAATGEHGAKLFGGGAGVPLGHLPLEVVAGVGEEVDDHGASAGFEDARHLCEHGGGIFEVGEDEDQQGGVTCGGVDRDGSELAAAEVDVGVIGEALLGGLEHLGGVVDRDDLPDVRGKLLGEVARAGAEVGDDVVGGDEREQRRGG